MNHEIFALLVFFATYAWLSTERSPAHVVALSGAAVLISGHILTIHQALAQIDWNTILLLLASFVVVVTLSESGFLTQLAHRVALKLGYHPVKIFWVFPILAGGLSMILNNITVMIFLAAVSIALCSETGLDPVLLVTAEVCCSNTAGGATILGSSSNLVMANALGYGFNSVAWHLSVPVWIAVGIMLTIFGFRHQTYLRTLADNHETKKKVNFLLDPRRTRTGLWALFGLVVILIGREFAPRGLRTDLPLGLAAMFPACILIIHEGFHRRNIIRRIDIETLLFFAGLFILMGSLEQVGLFQQLASFLVQVHQPFLLVLAFLWFSALVSAFVNNIPMAIAMAYLIRSLHTIPGAIPSDILVWASLLGLTIGGNMTPIGASANVVAYNALKRTKQTIDWKSWMRLTVPPALAALVVLSIGMGLVYRCRWY